MLTGPDAVDDAEEGVAVAPALAEVADLDAKLVCYLLRNTRSDEACKFLVTYLLISNASDKELLKRLCDF